MTRPRFRLHLIAAAAAAFLAAVPAGAQDAMPQTAAEHILLGDSAHAAFESEAALRHYEAAIGSDSANATAWAKASLSAVDLGEGTIDQKRQRELFRLGERYARRAVALDSTSAENQFHLARALGRSALSVGVRDRVKYAVEVRDRALKALAIDPDHPGALHVLGMWNAEVMRLNGFEKFFARNFLGGGVLGKASWDEAVRNLERAVAVDPDRLTHRVDLAKIYADIGQKAKAREQYEVVLNATAQTDVNDSLYKRQAEAGLARLR
jgi:tetratricopeptide (TPR) repeat protein